MSEEFMTEMIRKIAEGKYTQDELSVFLKELDKLDEASYIRVFNALYADVSGQIPGEIDPIFKARLKEKLNHLPAEDDSFKERGRQVVPMRPGRRGLRWAAAAAVLLISFGSYFYFHSKNTNSKTTSLASVPTDIKAPRLNRATITLGGGQKVFLDSIVNGQIASQNNVRLIKTGEGKIAYDGSAQVRNSALILNTLTNPKGSRVIDIQLADGTHVWLNAGSSLTYPVAFAGNERRISITGEAYFEVAHKASWPFVVTKGETEVKVLGTHFNVNAYEDEEDIQVTLLEGSVRVTNKNNFQSLSPGQQVEINRDGLIGLKRSADIESVMAWKNGVFDFDRQNITDIMRQLSRWYNAEIVYEGEKPADLFSCMIKRDNNISQVLKLFEQTGRVHFKIEGER